MTVNGVKHTDKLVTFAYSPGYRHCSITVAMKGEQCKNVIREINLDATDSYRLYKDLKELLKTAWEGPDGFPLDFLQGESVVIGREKDGI